jgi:photosynthetic reaction center cytochrome c subunit
MNLVRSFCVLLCLLFAGCVFSVASSAQGNRENAVHHPPEKTAAQQFKNIQVLKDIPADQLIPAMQFIASSLGVDCEFCHVEHAFDKDDKKTKRTARKMMEMMMNINRENFDGQRQVTCYSCHRGKPMPVATPIITTELQMPEMMAGETVPASALPKPQELLDKYLAAVGGAAALQKVSSRVEKGNLTAFGNQKMPIEIYAEAPDKRVSIMHMGQGESITAYNGKIGWLSFPGRVHFMNAQESWEARIDADLRFPADLARMYQKFVVHPGENIGGQDTWLVIGQSEGQPPLKLYFDQNTGLLVRMLRYVDSPLGYNPTQIDYADYRESDGVKIPFRWTLARPGNRFTIQVTEIQTNVPVDDSLFTPPKPPAGHP